MPRPYNHKFKNLEAVTAKELDKKLDEIETKDLYNVLDDSDLKLNDLAYIMAEKTMSWPPGVRIQSLMCENLSYTPYFYHETTAQKEKYQEFIKSLSTIWKP